MGVGLWWDCGSLPRCLFGTGWRREREKATLGCYCYSYYVVIRHGVCHEARDPRVAARQECPAAAAASAASRPPSPPAPPPPPPTPCCCSMPVLTPQRRASLQNGKARGGRFSTHREGTVNYARGHFAKPGHRMRINADPPSSRPIPLFSHGMSSGWEGHILLRCYICN